MRLLYKVFPGTLEEVCDTLNQCSGAPYVMFFRKGLTQQTHDDCVEVVLRFPDYPSYVWFCEKLKEEPMSVTEYIHGPQKKV